MLFKIFNGTPEEKNLAILAWIGLFLFLFLLYRLSKVVEAIRAWLKVSYRLTKALLTRLIYFTHAGIALWRVQVVLNNPYVLFGLYILYAGILFEGYYNLKSRVGKEYKWWSPVTACYLAAIVPCIILLEIHNHETKGALHITTYETNSAGLVALFKHIFDDGNSEIPYEKSKSKIFTDIYKCSEDYADEDAKIAKPFCSCLAEDYYDTYFVHFGEKFFKPLHKIERHSDGRISINRNYLENLDNQLGEEISVTTPNLVIAHGHSHEHDDGRPQLSLILGIQKLEETVSAVRLQ